MEYKKTIPAHGKVNGRYSTMYEYEFPRATRAKGKFLPLGSVRVREFIYNDGSHGQLVQIISISAEKLAKKNEGRALVDKLLDLGRESKKFSEGVLASQMLSGEIREYPAKKMICLDEILSNQEKIGLFAAARRVKNSKLRKKRITQWKIRLHLMVILALFVLGGMTGALLEKYKLLDLKENIFYQEYILTSINTLSKLFFKTS